MRGEGSLLKSLSQMSLRGAQAVPNAPYFQAGSHGSIRFLD